MKKFCLLLSLMFVAVSFANAQEILNKAKLNEVKKIYVDSLGNNEEAEILREKLKIRLAEKGRFQVVEKEENADAVLTGKTALEKDLTASDNPPTVVKDKKNKTTTVYGGSSGSNTNSTFVGVFRLIDAKTGENLWIYDFGHKKFLGIFSQTNRSSHDAYNQAAKRTVKKLLEAVKES